MNRPYPPDPFALPIPATPAFPAFLGAALALGALLFSCAAAAGCNACNTGVSVLDTFGKTLNHAAYGQICTDNGLRYGGDGNGESVNIFSSEPDALEDAGACSATAEDDACVSCAKTACCEESLGCFGDTACECIATCRTATGDTAAACEAAGRCDAAPTAAYATFQACMTSHCVSQCPEQQ